jgi:hypothetical protein
MTVTINYSPWYQKLPYRNRTYVTGPPETAELQAQLANLRSWLSSAGSSSTQLGAVLFGSEEFHCSAHDTAEYRAALTGKHDLIWNLTRQIFPGVRIELYD